MLERRPSSEENGQFFFQLLHNDPLEMHWFQDAEGYKLCTLRYPIVESFRRLGFQEAEVCNHPYLRK